MNSTKSPPLVSIIVRTMGRPEASRALASIAAQSHRPIETVLVDAASRGLARAAAANAGLASARGEWIGFLDEDDELEPDHVARLLAAALVSGAPVAYSQTRIVDRAGNTVRVFGGGPFNRAALLRSNYIAIHAA